MLGGAPVDIPEEEEDDTDLGVNISCGEFNDEVSRLGENCGERFKQGEESGKHIEGETKAAVEVDAVLLRFCGLSGVTKPEGSSTTGGQDCGRRGSSDCTGEENLTGENDFPFISKIRCVSFSCLFLAFSFPNAFRQARH